jgi:glycosyltransferase involved in cell wall biosynthesis
VTVWTVIPALDEAATVALVVRAARSFAPVLVVDDGSRDGTAAVARLAGAEVITHARTRGKGAALRTGFAFARARGARWIATLDADGQHDAADLPRLLATARAMPGAIVVGSRVDDERGLSPERQSAVRVAAFFTSWATGLAMRDTQCGFRVYPADLFAEIEVSHRGFVFETEVLLAAARAGHAIKEVPIVARPRAARPSRFRPLRDGMAIAAYLAGPVAKRWAWQLATAARGDSAGEHGRGRAALAAIATPVALPLLALEACGVRAAGRVLGRLVHSVYAVPLAAGRAGPRAADAHVDRESIAVRSIMPQ